jgi:hypothetical protein
MSRFAATALVLVACHSPAPQQDLGSRPTEDPGNEGTEAKAHVKLPRSALAQHVAQLPLAIVDLELERRSILATASGDFDLDESCWSGLLEEVRGLYAIELDHGPPAEQIVHLNLLDTDVTLDEIKRCRTAGKRKEAKHPRMLVTRDSGFFPAMFSAIGPGWMLLASGEYEPILATSQTVLAEPVTAKNPLARLVDQPFSAATWRVMALDITGEVLGVPSIGVRMSPGSLDSNAASLVPINVQVLFATEADARRAFSELEAPAANNQFASQLRSDHGALLQFGKLRVDGAAIEFRGEMTYEAFERARDGAQMFVGRARPVVPLD